MTEYFGNLALQRKNPPLVRKAGQVAAPRRSEIKTRRVPVTATVSCDAACKAREGAIRRSLTRQRVKLLMSIVMIIFMVSSVFALIVYRQAIILEMNFHNLSIANQIAKIDQTNSQISEELAQKTNLDLIRQQAVNRLGLQDPARSQIVNVILPNTDRVVLAAPDAFDIGNESYLADVLSNIEGYFRTLGQQRQGD